MGKNKLKKFAQVKEMPHVFEPAFADISNGNHPLKGNWRDEFGNDNPIVLELACGKGEYSVGMAQLFPEKNFVGIDIKGSRMFSGAKEVEEKGLKNVRFLRTRIDLINAFFATDDVSEIWILFADPQIRKPRKRLTSPLFLDRYVELMKPGGTLNLKCDSDELYAFTKFESIPGFNKSSLRSTFDLQFDTNNLYDEGIYQLSPIMQDVLNIRTYYEQMWLEQGKKIKYVSYRLLS